MNAMDAKRPFGRVAVVLAFLMSVALFWSGPVSLASVDERASQPSLAVDDIVLTVDESTADLMLVVGMIEELGEDEAGSPIFALAAGGDVTVLVVIGNEIGTPWQGGGQTTGNTESMPEVVPGQAPGWIYISCQDNGDGTRTACYRRDIRCRQWRLCVKVDGNAGTQERYFWVRETYCETLRGACNGNVPGSPVKPPEVPTVITIGGDFQLVGPMPAYGKCR
jgi:hypothetical protein